jgi:hypothetical protein
LCPQPEARAIDAIELAARHLLFHDADISSSPSGPRRCCCVVSVWPCTITFRPPDEPEAAPRPDHFQAAGLIRYDAKL